MQKYIRKVRRLQRRYGEHAWALLYQAEDRMRREEFSRIYRHLSAKAEDKGPDVVAKFEAKPWDAVFLYAVERSQEFWAEEYTEAAQLIRVDGTVLKMELGKDAPIEGRGDEETRRPARNPGRGAGGGDNFPPRGAPPGGDVGNPRKRGGQREHDVDEHGHDRCNRNGVSLCDGFQTGACPHKRGQIRCPKNNAKTHQCAKCLSPDHGMHRCPDKDSTPQMPSNIAKSQQRGRGQGRGGGRGGARHGGR